MALYITPFGRLVRSRVMNNVAGTDWGAGEAQVTVPMNVKADEEGYTLTAVLPGVKSDDLSVEVMQRTVTIEGVMRDDEVENEHYLLREHPTGKFSRAVRLPEQVDASKVDAELKDGILTLRIPKAEEARPRKIKVNLN